MAFHCLLQRLATIVSLIPALGATTRLLDVGSGTGCLIPHLQSQGVADITAVDLSPAMLEQLAARFPAPSVCGNEPGGASRAAQLLGQSGGGLNAGHATGATQTPQPPSQAAAIGTTLYAYDMSHATKPAQ
jgi:SAM-dependent methyltransferase